jgi:uncharacterized Tic20 family protein
VTEPTQAPPGSALPRPEERNWALAAHLGPIVLSFLSAGIFGWLVPLVIWLTQKESSPFAANHARESLNFRITLLIAYVAAIVLILVLIGIPLLIAIIVTEIVLSVIAAIRASEGKPYRYPVALPLFR